MRSEIPSAMRTGTRSEMAPVLPCVGGDDREINDRIEARVLCRSSTLTINK